MEDLYITPSLSENLPYKKNQLHPLKKESKYNKILVTGESRLKSINLSAKDQIISIFSLVGYMVVCVTTDQHCCCSRSPINEHAHKYLNSSSLQQQALGRARSTEQSWPTLDEGIQIFVTLSLPLAVHLKFLLSKNISWEKVLLHFKNTFNHVWWQVH